MPISITTPPAAEPITLAEAKLHLRVDGSDEDTLISALITSARQRVEHLTGRALITRTLTETRDAPPTTSVLTLATGPVSAVHAVTTTSADGAVTTLDAASYTLDEASIPGRLGLVSGSVWATDARDFLGFSVAYDAGYGTSGSDAPGPLRDAIMLLIADAYAYRDAGERALDADELPLPPAVAGLIAPYQQVRL